MTPIEIYQSPGYEMRIGGCLTAGILNQRQEAEERLWNDFHANRFARIKENYLLESRKPGAEIKVTTGWKITSRTKTIHDLMDIAPASTDILVVDGSSISLKRGQAGGNYYESVWGTSITYDQKPNKIIVTRNNQQIRFSAQNATLRGVAPEKTSQPCFQIDPGLMRIIGGLLLLNDKEFTNAVKNGFAFGILSGDHPGFAGVIEWTIVPQESGEFQFYNFHRNGHIENFRKLPKEKQTANFTAVLVDNLGEVTTN